MLTLWDSRLNLLLFLNYYNMWNYVMIRRYKALIRFVIVRILILASFKNFDRFKFHCSLEYQFIITGYLSHLYPIQVQVSLSKYGPAYFLQTITTLGILIYLFVYLYIFPANIYNLSIGSRSIQWIFLEFWGIYCHQILSLTTTFHSSQFTIYLQSFNGSLILLHPPPPFSLTSPLHSSITFHLWLLIWLVLKWCYELLIE